MIAILKQRAQQLKGYSNSNGEGGYILLYPFDCSRDYYSTPWKAFTDSRNGKEYILKYKNDEDRLAKLKKINTAITSNNKVAAKNYKECISKLSPDRKISGLLSHWLKVRVLPGVHDEKTTYLS